ncbi:MAG: conjugal transfer protein TraG N-terminal domain-containing protein [Pseudomonadota bacterium]|jgi:conjugal transfer mating pair stabilization protein TraG
MEYEIYTFGNGEILQGVFNSIAACLNGHTGTLYEPLKRIGMILGVFWAALYAVYGDMMKPLTHWILPMSVFTTLLFAPQASVWIHDPVTKFHQKVDNLPYGLAAFAGYISKFGNVITEQVEKVFTLPDDLKYQKSGSLFAGNIIQQAKSFHITNEDLAENMRGFVGQCILYDAMLGRKYTVDDLRHSDDIWELVSTNASPVRSFLWREPRQAGEAGARPEIITCREGVARFNRLWGQELDRSATIFGKKIFGNHALINGKAELLKYLPLSYGSLGNIAKSAQEIIQQQIMIYSIVDGIEANGAAVGNAQNFAARRAYLQQRSTYETLGAMAGETLPTMKAVLEAIAYACFLFIIPMALLPFGYQFLLRWAQILLWLQMWAPLYAILNYVMTMAARSKTLSLLSLSNEAGVTIASSVGIANLNTDIASMAGYLAMSIPFLCIAIVKGVGSFVHMASHLGNVGQGAASMAATEVTSGNLSFGNISEGNVQISNGSILQRSNAAAYKAHSFSMQDGRVEMTTMADGSQISNIGTSNLPISLNVAESQSNQLSEMASRSYQNAMNLSESSSQHLSSSARSAVSLSDTLSKFESLGDTTSHGISIEQSQAIHHGANLVRDFAKQNQIDTGKSAQILANASFGSGRGGLGGSIGMSGDLSAREQDIYIKAQKFAEDHNYQEAMREAASASQQLSHSITDEKARRLAEEISGSYEHGVNQRSEAAKSFRNAEDYSHQASYTRANSATINYNASQQFGEWLAAQPADNTKGHLGTRGAAHIMAHNPKMAMAYAGRYMAERGLNPGGISTPPSAQVRSQYDAEQGHQSYAVTKDSLRQVRNQAGDIASTSGVSTRQNAEEKIIQGHNMIGERSNETLSHGSALKQNVHTEQNKGVVKRVGNKGIQEVNNMVNDAAEAGKKIWSGESQQK